MELQLMKTFKDIREARLFKIVSNSPNKHGVHAVVGGRTKSEPVGIFTTRAAAEREVTRQRGQLHEDGGAPGAGAPAGAPANVTGGLASIKNPDGTTASPPVSVTAQKKIQKQGAGSKAKLRRVLDTVNVKSPK